MARHPESDESGVVPVSRRYVGARRPLPPVRRTTRAETETPAVSAGRPGEAIARVISESILSDGDKEDLAFEFAARLARWNGDDRAEKVVENPDLPELLEVLRATDAAPIRGASALRRTREQFVAINWAVKSVAELIRPEEGEADRAAVLATAEAARAAALASIRNTASSREI